MQSTDLRNVAYVLLFALVAGCQQASVPSFESKAMAAEPATTHPKVATSNAGGEKLATATFGEGCFWCSEAVFQNLNGVKSVVSGYSGGTIENPSYQDVCTGRTGHAEVIQVTYDPAVISFENLLKVFWQTHDPTTLDRQGHDSGTQYRSAVFYHDDAQKRIAEQYKQQLDASKVFKDPIVTEITPFKNFYPAEKYHQNYFNLNPTQQYCQYVIRPKVEKFNKEFKAMLKDAAEPAEKGATAN
ncbi:MAG TPA: peptide-methionine (S)-S-oxide reductase MsrA [Lacipirellulaceae bacterium]|nr:peptide-methionine (S)-S-oxide reductase MsrA [Lacipirellulaceae bacterium]